MTCINFQTYLRLRLYRICIMTRGGIYGEIKPEHEGNPAELLNAEAVRSHDCAIFLRICAKFVLFNAKQGKQALFNDLAQFDKILKKYIVLLWHFRTIPFHTLFSKKIWLHKRICF